MSIRELIHPKNIRTDGRLQETFGKFYTETSALHIVRFLQHRAKIHSEFSTGWEPFKIQELTQFYQEDVQRKEEFVFNGLNSGRSPHVEIRDGMVYINDSFIQCMIKNSALIRSVVDDVLEE